MKKIYLYVYLSLTAAATSAQNIVFPDANFKAKLLSSSPSNLVARSLSGSYFAIDSNNDDEIQVTEALMVRQLNVDNSNISNMEGIQYFTQLANLSFSENSVTSVDLSSLSMLTGLYCNDNQLTALDISANPNISYLYFAVNQIQTIDVSNLVWLVVMDCAYNNFTSLDFDSETIMQLTCGYNPMTSLDVSGMPKLEFLNCQELSITTLDCQNNSKLNALYMYGNYFLETLFLKNGSNESADMDPGSWWENFVLSTNLQYICADENEILPLQTLVGSISGFQPVLVNTYCSFTPGGNYNTLSGVVSFDADNNGCDVNDNVFRNIKIGLSDGTNSYAGFTKADGSYKFYVETGNFTVSPALENAAFFNVSPPSVTHNFTGLGNDDVNQDFCITANGIHPDLEIVMFPVGGASPGFYASYEIVIRNKGNQVLSQQYGVNFFYNANLMSFFEALPAAESITPGGLSWSYANLLPFETRSIVVRFLLNTPMDANPVQMNDVLTYTASILPMANDENTSDNIFVLDQTVIGPYDPNDIMCLEGDVVPPSEIGDYLHYLINFENIGTAAAQNVVVKVQIDETKFNVGSLQLLQGSHAVEAKVSGNTAEFIFEAIYLESGGHGNILLKIRTVGDLPAGTTVLKSAGIYFDYNFPVLTNEAATSFETLSIDDLPTDRSIRIYPNPTSGEINISSDNEVQSVKLFDFNGRILMKQSGVLSMLKIGDYASGIYFVVIETSKGQHVEKIVRK